MPTSMKSGIHFGSWVVDTKNVCRLSSMKNGASNRFDGSIG